MKNLYLKNHDKEVPSLKVKWRGGFADRNNHASINIEIQKTSLDERIRTRLFNFFVDYIEIFNLVENASIINLFLREFYLTDILYSTSDIYSHEVYTIFISAIKDSIYKDHWYNVFSLIEFWNEVDNILNKNSAQVSFKKEINDMFEKEFVGYRFVDKFVAPIIDDLEIKTIENISANPYSEVRDHISKALGKLSDRENPDYENSIKESISSVEAMSKIITGLPKATLTNALNKLENRGVYIHPQMKEAFINLYRYASDGSGVRHSKKIGGVKSSFEEAKFMLVACSAFNNYLVSNTKDNKWTHFFLCLSNVV